MRFMTSLHSLVLGYREGISLLFATDWQVYDLAEQNLNS